MQVDLGSHAIAGTIVSEPGYIDLPDTPDPELEGVPLPHAVHMISLEPFARWLRLRFDPDKEAIFLEDAMACSPGTGEVELVLDPPGSPGRIFLLKSDDPLFQ
jgi:hypothetical protein